MFSELIAKIREYQAKGSDFAIAQVIAREAPCSGKVGDKALILETGELVGWIGGGCVKGIVVKEGLEVIKNKRYRRVRISPEGGTSDSEQYKNYVMSCQSEGTVELLIEPILAQPEIIVVGKSEIARKLVRLAAVSGFGVSAMANDADEAVFPEAMEVIDGIQFGNLKNSKNAYIIVATQGEEDEKAVLEALKTESNYIGFVASKKKATHIREYLEGKKISSEQIENLHSPAGLDINAKLASEVAISILGGIIADFRKKTVKPKERESSSDKPQTITADDKFAEDYYINPVCGVPVSKKNPKHILDYKGESVYFCCDGCKISFEKDPDQYMLKK